MEKLRELCEDFTATVCMVTALLDLEGNILLATGWQDICTHFHRVNGGTAIRCRESDSVLAGGLRKGELYNIYKCKNGLVDVAVPITIHGEHVANFFTGQFFTNVPDKEYFIRQAEQFGFDKESYLEALSRVPVFSEEKIRTAMSFLTKLAQLIGEMGHARKELVEANKNLAERSEELTTVNLSLQEEIKERKVADKALRDSEYLQKTILNNIPDMAWIKDTRGKYLAANEAYALSTGRSVREIVGTTDDNLWPSELAHKYQSDDLRVMQSASREIIEETLVDTHGATRWVETIKTPLTTEGGEIFGTAGIARDISERKHAEEERLSHLRFLENLSLIDRAIRLEGSQEEVMSAVLDTVLSIFEIDRAWLLYPCDPEADTWSVPMERTRPEYPGAFALGVDLPLTPDLRQAFSEALSSSGPSIFGPQTGRSMPVVFPQFSIQSHIHTVLYPKRGKPWLFGMHQCSYARVWSEKEIQLFTEIARRIADALSSQLYLKDLLESEQRFKTLFEQAAVGVALIETATGRFLSINNKYCDIVGYSREEMLQSNFQQITHPDDLQSDLDNMHRLIQGEFGEFCMEKRYLRKDGSIVWVDLTVSPTWPQNTKPDQHIAVVQDITERKRAEKELHDSEEKFRNLVNNALVAIFQSTLAGDFLHVNQALLTMLGYQTREEFIKTKAWDIYRHREDRENFIRELQERGEISDLEIEFKTRDGKPLWIMMNATLTGDVLTGMFSNITELKLTQWALEESGRELMEAQKMARLGSWKWDIATGSVVWSEEVYRIFRLDPRTFTPQIDSIIALSPWPGDNERHQEIIRRAIDNHEQGSFEQRFLRPDGSTGYYYSTFRGLFDDNDNLVTMMGTVQDITERKRDEELRVGLERQILHNQKLESLGILAGGIAHDFNNILTAIVGYTELSKMKLNPDSPVFSNLQKIEQSAARATDLAKQMLAYSGKGHFKLENINLNRLLSEMSNLLEVAISNKTSIRLNLASPLPSICADATQIRQIIINMVINAAEAVAGADDMIAISTGSMKCDPDYLQEIWMGYDIAGGEYVYIDVADSGCGMDVDTIAKIFDPFFSTKFTGRGLGMAAVQGVVRGHRGAIKVQSEIGKGSTFRVLFPAVSTAAAEIDNKGDAATVCLGSGTVLLVDDEEAIRDIGSEMLHLLGYEVITACDGREALDIYQARSDFTFVILDLTMPKMDGRETFEKLQQINKDVKVFISSGYSEDEVARFFSDKGWAGYIQKPYVFSTIKDVIAKVDNKPGREFHG